MNILQALNTRELASLIWILGFVIVSSLINKEFRLLPVGILKFLSDIKFLTLFLAMAVYTSSVVFSLHYFGFWELEQIPGTLIWFVFALVRTGQYIKDPYGLNLVQDFALYHLRLFVVVQFILNVYTFSLPAELLITPFIVVVMIVQELGREKIRKIVEWLRATIGLVLLGNVGYRLFIDYRSFFQLETGRNFITPALLSLILLPLVYSVALYASYEKIFSLIKIGTSESRKEVRKYAKRQFLIRCQFNLRQAQHYAYKKEGDLMKIYDKEDVDNLLENET